MINNFKEYIKHIIDSVCVSTEDNHERLLCNVLEEYYLSKGKKFEAVSSNGGDNKNDGWVKEDAIFYQIYAPASFTKAKFKTKFKNDIEGLLKLVYHSKLWGGRVNEFIFVVNRFIDQELPEDSTGYFDNIVNNLKNKYNIKFKHKIVTTSKYLFEILFELNNNKEILDKISLKVNGLSHEIYNQITHSNVRELIEIIQTKINQNTHLFRKSIDYKRISNDEKIKINNLEDIKEEIEKHLLNLGIIQEVWNEMLQDQKSSEVFEDVIKTIISKYLELQKIYQGINLFNKLVQDVISLAYESKKYKLLVELLVVFVFDKCDIFKKVDD